MTSGSIQRRLMALEARANRIDQLQAMHPVLRLLDTLVAYHLGQIREDESIAAGMARGLGYDNPSGLQTALMAGEQTAKSDDLNLRWRDAMRRLFALKGAPVDCDGATFGATLEALRVEMPDRLQRSPFLSSSDGLKVAVYDLFL